MNTEVKENITLPDPSHFIWRDLVTGKKSYQFQFLAAKLLLSRIQIQLRNRHSETLVQHSMQELHDLLQKNKNVPSARKDIENLFGKA